MRQAWLAIWNLFILLISSVLQPGRERGVASCLSSSVGKTHDFPENMGPRMSCRKRGYSNWSTPKAVLALAGLSGGKGERRGGDRREMTYLDVAFALSNGHSCRA